jgi:hypothetical protein
MLIDGSKLHQRNFTDMLAQYEEAKAWMETLGIKVSRTRFQRYKESIEKSLQPSSAPYNLDQDQNLLWAIAEIHDLLDIHFNLKDMRDVRLVESLKKIIKGPTLLEGEKADGGSIHGRNFTFELYAASRLARAGFPIEFNTLADANFRVHGSQMHLECKRIMSENNMEDCIELACKQIATRCQDNQADRGIVAVSISKLVWKALRDAAPGVHADIAKIRPAMIASLDKWGPEITKSFKRFNQHTIAILLHYKMPFRRRPDGAPAFLNRFSVYPLCEPAAPEIPVLAAIMNALHDSMNPARRMW